MSTKTSIKRIALVAVSALGFGLLSVMPARADIVVSSATLDSTTTVLAGRVGQQVSIPVLATPTAVTASGTNSTVLSFAAAITSQPAGSALYADITPRTSAILTNLVYAATGVTAAGTTAIANATKISGSSTRAARVNYATADRNANTAADLAATQANFGTITFTPTVAGTYSITAWNETAAQTAEPALSGSESFQTFTVNVTSSAPSTVTLTGYGTTSAAGGASGALVKVTLKDAAGNIAIPATGETVTLTPSGTGLIAKVNDATATGATAGGAWNLAAADFGQTGVAWVNVTNANATDITLTATVSGSSSAAISLSYKTVTVTAGNAPTPYSATATGYTHSGTTTGTTTIPLGAVTTTYVTSGTYNATTTVYHKYLVTDTSGNITGVANLDWDAAAAVGSTDVSSYSVTTTSTTAAQQYTIANYASGGAQTTTTSSAAVTTSTITPTVNTIAATSGGSVTITGTLKDTFSRALGSTAVTATVTGRNPSTLAQTAITDSLGNFSFTIADANTTSLLTSDTVTLASAAYTTTSKTVTILYGTANAASKVVLTTPNVTAGVANDSVSAKPISAGTSATGKAGAEAGAFSITAKVTNSAGAVLSGVPVTWSVAGDGAAILSTTKLVYTDLTGTATAKIYGWKSGTYTVTATAGAISGTGTVTFAQSTASSARKITATASGSVVTAKAEDRFGNPVSGVRIYAKIASGTGYFGTGVTDTFADTTVDGTAKFVVSGGSSSVTVSNISFSSPAGTVVGQTSAAAGSDIGGADAVAFVAPVAGTATVAETGTGNVADFTAAGVSSATVSVTVEDSAAAAADAAAEAIDAANAATDAANLAAEAADAATVAAEEARDAADAATAAVEELASQVATLMAALKAQITTLANTVAKIAKKVKA